MSVSSEEDDDEGFLGNLGCDLFSEDTSTSFSKKRKRDRKWLPSFHEQLTNATIDFPPKLTFEVGLSSFSDDNDTPEFDHPCYDAAVVLSGFLAKHQKELFSQKGSKHHRVLELGAGCALNSMLFFQIASLQHHRTDIVVTDREDCLKLAERNCMSIRKHIKDGNGQIVISKLDWGNLEHIRDVLRLLTQKKSQKEKMLQENNDDSFGRKHEIEHEHGFFDFVLCSDLLYAEECIPLLAKTFVAVTKPGSTIFFSYEIRGSDSGRDILGQKFEQAIKIQKKMNKLSNDCTGSIDKKIDERHDLFSFSRIPLKDQHLSFSDEAIQLCVIKRLL
eukprot:g139.t1